MASGSNSAIFSALMHWAGQRLARGSDSADIHHLQGELHAWIDQIQNRQNSAFYPSAVFVSEAGFWVNVQISTFTPNQKAFLSVSYKPAADVYAVKNSIHHINVGLWKPLRTNFGWIMMYLLLLTWGKFLKTHLHAWDQLKINNGQSETLTKISYPRNLLGVIFQSASLSTRSIINPSFWIVSHESNISGNMLDPWGSTYHSMSVQ